MGAGGYAKCCVCLGDGFSDCKAHWERLGLQRDVNTALKNDDSGKAAGETDPDAGLGPHALFPAAQENNKPSTQHSAKP